MSKQPTNATDIDGFMEDCQRLTTKYLKTIGVDLLEIGCGLYEEDSLIIGAETAKALIFGKVACERMGVTCKEFQYPLDLDELLSGRVNTHEVADAIAYTLKQEFTVGRITT